MVLHRSLRPHYPIYEKRQSVSVGPGPVENSNDHLFHSKSRDWTVLFKSTSISIETQKYTTSTVLFSNVHTVVDAVKQVIDADFFTRIGLRFIDAIPLPDGKPDGWINAQLVQPLTDGIYGEVDRLFQEVRGRAKSGSYGFRHGLFAQADGHNREYILDFDFYAEDVDVVDAIARLRDFHEESYCFFDWSLGPKARDHMGPELPLPGKLGR